jgi:GNAT superfamily N-acetyltransferase
MLEVLRNINGDMIAVCEYLLFDKGELSDRGETLFISELEINPEHRGKGLIRYFINTILDKYPKFEWCLFCREKKYPERQPKIWNKSQLERLRKGE